MGVLCITHCTICGFAFMAKCYVGVYGPISIMRWCNESDFKIYLVGLLGEKCNLSNIYAKNRLAVRTFVS